jgi:type IV secretion system protein TrbL
VNWLKSLGGSIAKSVAGDAFHAIAVAFATAASHVLGWLWGELDSATAVSLQGPAFTRMLDITFTIAIVIGVALYAIQVAVSVLRRDFSGLGRALRGVVVAELGTFAAIIVTNELLAATDSLSAGVMQAGAGVSSFEGLGNLIASGGVMAKLTDAAMLLVALVLIVGSVMVWFALMVRKLLVIIAAVFAPIAFAGAQADISMGWVRRWIEGMVALVFSKLLLVLVLVIGWNVLLGGLGNTGSPSVTQEVTGLLTGALILCVGGLAPWAALKMVHFAGEYFHQIHAHAASAQQAGMAVVSAPRRGYSGAMIAARKFNGQSQNGASRQGPSPSTQPQGRSSVNGAGRTGLPAAASKSGVGSAPSGATTAAGGGYGAGAAAAAAAAAQTAKNGAQFATSAAATAADRTAASAEHSKPSTPPKPAGPPPSAPPKT